MLPREDAHPQLFRDYQSTLSKLAAGAEQAPALRQFEVQLLAQLGYALPLTHEVDSGLPVDPGARYYYAFDRGPRTARVGTGSGVIRWFAAPRCWRSRSRTSARRTPPSKPNA